MRGLMLNYRISDSKIREDIKLYLTQHPNAKKEQVFKHLVGRYGVMDRDDFDANWQTVRKN
jgi:hypothetical protein